MYLGVQHYDNPLEGLKSDAEILKEKAAARYAQEQAEAAALANKFTSYKNTNTMADEDANRLMQEQQAELERRRANQLATQTTNPIAPAQPRVPTQPNMLSSPEVAAFDGNGAVGVRQAPQVVAPVISQPSVAATNQFRTQPQVTTPPNAFNGASIQPTQTPQSGSALKTAEVDAATQSPEQKAAEEFKAAKDSTHAMWSIDNSIKDLYEIANRPENQGNARLQVAVKNKVDELRDKRKVEAIPYVKYMVEQAHKTSRSDAEFQEKVKVIRQHFPDLPEITYYEDKAVGIEQPMSDTIRKQFSKDFPMLADIPNGTDIELKVDASGKITSFKVKDEQAMFSAFIKEFEMQGHSHDKAIALAGAKLERIQIGIRSASKHGGSGTGAKEHLVRMYLPEQGEVVVVKDSADHKKLLQTPGALDEKQYNKLPSFKQRRYQKQGPVGNRVGGKSKMEILMAEMEKAKEKK